MKAVPVPVSVSVSVPLSSSRILITILSPVAEQRRNLELVYRHFTDRINIREPSQLSTKLEHRALRWELGGVS